MVWLQMLFYMMNNLWTERDGFIQRILAMYKEYVLNMIKKQVLCKYILEMTMEDALLRSTRVGGVRSVVMFGKEIGFIALVKFLVRIEGFYCRAIA